jgi:hypothetical protein
MIIISCLIKLIINNTEQHVTQIQIEQLQNQTLERRISIMFLEQMINSKI